MIVKSYEEKKITDEKINILLFYGKNDGFLNAVLEKLFLKSFDGLISKYDEVEFINNYDIIFNELMSRSLFDENKIIIISRASDKITKYIDELLNNNLENIKIILRSGILEKKSSLRNFFEKNKKLIVVPFYEDDIRSLNSIAFDYLNKNKIKLSMESVNLLISRCSGNRGNLITELEKILNYSKSNRKINFDVVQKLSNLAENYDLNELADSYLSKNKRNIAKILNENNFSEEDCILLLRTILMKSKRLMNIIERLKINKNIDEVISLTKPPIFWKDKENVKIQVNTWELDELKNKIYQINEIETLVKTNFKNSLNLVSDFIVNH